MALVFDPPLDSPEYRAQLAKLLAGDPVPPRTDYAIHPSGRIDALRARADMLIRQAADDMREANRLAAEEAA